MVGVGVTDGTYNAKMDVIIQVTSSDGSELPPPNNRFNPVPLPSNVNPPPALPSTPFSPAIPPRPAAPPVSGSSSGVVNFSKFLCRKILLLYQTEWLFTPSPLLRMGLPCVNLYFNESFSGTDDKYATPPIQPLTVPADRSITPSPSTMPEKNFELAPAENETAEGTPTVVSKEDPPMDTADTLLSLNLTTVIIPIVVVLAVVLLALGVFFVVVRLRRSGKRSVASSTSVDAELKESKADALKTISSTTITSSTSSTSTDDDTSISLQHWTSKKAVSNRYESWHIGEIDQEWVRRRKIHSPPTSVELGSYNLASLLFTFYRGTRIKRKMGGNFLAIICMSSVFWAKDVLVKCGNAKPQISEVNFQLLFSMTLAYSCETNPSFLAI